MATPWSKEKLLNIVNEYETEKNIKLISSFIDRLDALQLENEFYKNQKQFISMLTHQLRTPLTSILWTIESMQADNSNRVALKDLRAKATELADIIKKLTNLLETDALKHGADTICRPGELCVGKIKTSVRSRR